MCSSMFSDTIMAIGGQGSKNIFNLFCRSHCCCIKAFYGMSKFNSVPKISLIQFLGVLLDFYVVNAGLIFGDFFTIFAYKILNIDVECTKIVTKMQSMARITKKISKIEKFENFGQSWANIDKMCHFLQRCYLFKIKGIGGVKAKKN